ncbi:glycosyltransferase family 25 protein [Acinetobacter indicus]|uniref:glycosyltransferase family 25 protein n=1 Tax=Acinetobacter indicus TaxID=756892 RepID=UPI000FDB896E|nr:glycosyltransferase family 25 protein [Acinetobacter indicus]MDM1769930.1 glycosyltransferase family 25 protein [Acinetobacter indicus]MDM1773068.1 glycosyltransferase family 25 protein [Acinetobacter indicus]QIC79868.1 glycosyltransferase family 25 protein [Acinetobacter indicus]RVT47763.1 glycosyltransferase family 25 protein [Acinetobacter indicus]
MKNIVISLKTAKARREHIEKEFGKQNIGFEFFDALTPDLAKPLAEKMALQVHEDFLTSGELACFMSHVSIWQKMVEEQIAHLAVFEDDVYLGENADHFLSQHDWIQNDWDIIKLEAFAKKILHASQEMPVGKNRSLFKLKGRHVGAAGYILSLKAAQYLIKLLKQNLITEPLDHILFDPKYHQHNMSLYQMKPALCIQSYLYEQAQGNQFGSMLEDQRVQRRQTESQARTFGEKISREWQRLKQQIHISKYKKTIEFK